ncbi:MAG TPA: inositol monophosphatase [Planctomycetes bacterium]|nr:inositol monophosphatase [Planctomycetota bacterium]
MLSGFMDAVVDLAVQAGNRLLEYQEMGSRVAASSKSASRDLVTQADLESEEILKAGLADLFPKDGILAEESGSCRNGEEIWMLDPLDGTVNFVHGLPMWAVSIARVDSLGPSLAVVHLPRLGETFTAIRGEGAFCNGSRLMVSDADCLADALLATGFPYRRHLLADNNLENFCRLFLRQRGVRRMGSAAVDLAYTAAGRLDVFWELHLQPYDVAAGGLLVTEAGGEVGTLRPGGDWIRNGNIVAGAGPLVAELRDILSENQPEEWPFLGDAEERES